MLLAVINASYKFLYIDVGSYGMDSDLTIFKNSTLYSLLTKNELNILEVCPIPNTNIIANCVFISDEEFGFFEHFLRPYSERNVKKTCI